LILRPRRSRPHRTGARDRQRRIGDGPALCRARHCGRPGRHPLRAHREAPRRGSDRWLGEVGAVS